MKHKITNKHKLTIIISIIFISMLILNLLTPLIADDFSYSFGIDGKIKNFYDIIIRQIDHYLTWGGRSVAHTIGQTLLLFPKTVFSILNTFAYIILIYLIYKIVKGKNEDKPSMLIIIHLLLWFVLPVFGQTCLWLIGSCNYLWTMDIILFLILQYKNNKVANKPVLKMILIFLLGIISGWTNENTAFGLIIVIIGLIYSMKKEKIKIEKWHISGLIGVILGFIILIIAPGNYVRNDVFNDNTFIIIKLINRTIEYTLNVTKYLLPLIILTIILISIKIYYKKEIKKDVIIYLIASFLSIYSMVLSPTFPERAWFGVIVYNIIGIIYLLYDIEKLNKIYTYIIADSIILFSILFINQYMQTMLSIKELKNTWNYRIDYINKEKNNGNLKIQVGQYITDNSHNPNYGLNDINTDEKTWPNTDIAEYFEIDSIKSFSN